MERERLERVRLDFPVCEIELGQFVDRKPGLMTGFARQARPRV